MKNISIAFILAICISGCATTPIPIPKETGSRIVVLRDTGFTGSGCTVTIRVDGEKVSMLDAGQSSSTEVLPGRRQVTAGTEGGGLCSGTFLTRMVNVKNSPVVLRVAPGLFDEIQ